MHKNQGSIYYSHYLHLDKLLASQEMLSEKFSDAKNPPAHDEMLFIIVHQAFELWFKQINHELNSIMSIFVQDKIQESQLSLIVHQLERIVKIQGLFAPQLEILETMTAMDFLEFRNLLIPASGFQSTQFREIEIKMGLSTMNRENIDREFFLGRLNEDDRQRLTQLEGQLSLVKLLEQWLERLPLTHTQDFNFWQKYKKAVDNLLNGDEQTLKQNLANLGEKEINAQLENIKLSKETFSFLFDETKHQELVQQGQRRLSQRAILNALFIQLYRDEPLLMLPHRIITLLMDIDENFTAWRYRHALLAQRMLGQKIGTGGSSGHQYLKRATENNRVFLDLFNLSTYLIPRSELPELPVTLKKQLGFAVEL